MLFKKKFSSSATRNVNYYYNKWNIKNKHHSLSLKIKNKAGTGNQGKRIIRTKTSILRKYKTIKINFSFRYRKLATIAAFTFIPFKNKIASLIYFSNGAITYYLTTENHILFSIINFNNKNKKFFRKFKIKNNNFMLFQIKKLSFVCCLELIPGLGSQYTRSPGTKSRIIKFDKSTHSALIQLPSKIKKIFSYYSFCSITPISLSNHKKYFNGKAGYWRNFGNKSIVRGVAMNPVDHPHGGRTKAIKYPRTPWGKTTKYK